MRNVAQVLAYELPIAFTVLSIIVLASSMNMTQIILTQSSKCGILGWYFIPCLIGFVIMFICTLAELNRCPFDLPEAESELICGYRTENPARGLLCFIWVNTQCCLQVLYSLQFYF